MERTAAVNDKLDAILRRCLASSTTRGVAGFSLLSLVTTTYNSFLLHHAGRLGRARQEGPHAEVIIQDLNRRLAGLPEAQAFAFTPPAIPGSAPPRCDVHSRGSRRPRPGLSGREHHEFLAAARKRPEFSRLFTTLLPSVPQFFAQVDRDKVLKQGIALSSVYQALQAFLGGAFVNYFNQYGRSGRCISRPRASSERGPRTSVSSMCATRLARRCPCPRWSR